MDKQQKPKAKLPTWPSISKATASAETESHGQEHHGKFATAINCMDGRVQLPVINWLREKLGVDYVDMITEPGPDKILAKGAGAAVDSIKARVLISVNKHGSDTILMVSHDLGFTRQRSGAVPGCVGHCRGFGGLRLRG